MEDIFNKYEKSWETLVQGLEQDDEIIEIIEEGKIWISGILKLTDGGRVRDIHQILIGEFSRIYSRTMRRFYAVNRVAKCIFTDLVMDELRTILEMMFQAYYLLRTDDPVQAALDAINLSGVSWAKTGDRLFNSGKLAKPEYDKETERISEKVRNEIFSKYAGRRPRFYADLSVAEVARQAGLERVYELSYNWLSAHAHNAPISELSALTKDEQGVTIALIPNRDAIEIYAEILSLLNQIAVLTSLGALSGFTEVDTRNAQGVLVSFKERYPEHGWDKEIETISQNWNLTLG